MTTRGDTGRRLVRVDVGLNLFQDLVTVGAVTPAIPVAWHTDRGQS